jgi:hypothetical protein
MKGLWMFLIVPLSDVFTVYEFIELNTRPLVGKGAGGFPIIFGGGFLSDTYPDVF